MSAEPTDLFTSTAIYGIHNSVNRHSFSNSNYMFIPIQCYNCDQTVYPFVNACICLRCRCFVHRSCVMKKTSVCQSFTFNSSRMVSSGDNLKNNVHAVNAHNIESIIDRAILVPHLLRFLPEPGSEFCVWRSILRALARQHISHTRTIAKIDPSVGAAQIQTQIVELLKDSQSFPGQVAYTVHSVYVKMGFSKHQLEQSSDKSSSSSGDDIVFDESAVAYDNSYDIKRHHNSSSSRNIELMPSSSSGSSSSSGGGYNGVSSNTDIDTKMGLLHAKECIDTVICAVNTVILDTSNLTTVLIPYTTHGNQTSVTILNLICSTVEQYMLELNFDILYSKLFKFCLLSSPSLSPIVVNYCQGNTSEVQSESKSAGTEENNDLSSAVLPLLSYVNDTRLLLLDDLALEMSKEKRAMGKLQCVVALLQRISSVFTMKKDDWNEYVEEEVHEEVEELIEEQRQGEVSPMGVGVVTHVEPTEEQITSTGHERRDNSSSSAAGLMVDGGVLDDGAEPCTPGQVKRDKAVLSLLHLRDDTPRESGGEDPSPQVTVEGSVLHYPTTTLRPSGPSIIDLTVPSPPQREGEEGTAAPPPAPVRPCDLYEEDHGSPVEEILRRQASQYSHTGEEAAGAGGRSLSHASVDSTISGGGDAAGQKQPYAGIGSGVKLKKLLKTINSTFINVTLNNLQSVTHPILSLTMKKTSTEDASAAGGDTADGNGDEEGGISLKKAVDSPAVRQRTLETDELLKIFCSLIVHQLMTNKVPWLADYAYMTSVLLREGDTLLGVEGYALATLEQCIYCLTKTNID